MESDKYSKKVAQQIAQYHENEIIHDLPDIFHVWSNEFVRPGFANVFSVESITEFYVEALAQANKENSRDSRILSVGCGDGSVEIDIAKHLILNGNSSFTIVGLDISPVLIERFKKRLKAEDLEDFITPLPVDLNEAGPLGKFNMVMAHHSLHHMLELDRVFDSIGESLEEGGVFATCDMIGRNGHMRWPEAESVLQMFWPMLTERQRYNHQLRRYDADRFKDHDCSKEGFEGIRAQDILPLILKRFTPYKFFGFGGFIDTIVGTGYGPGYNAEEARDVAFVMAMAKLNDMMLDCGMITPTSMAAYFTLDYRGEHFFRDRKADRVVRDPGLTPAWTRHYF